MSQPSFTQIWWRRAGREPGPQLASRPHSTCAPRTWLPNEEPRNSKHRLLRFPSVASKPALAPPLAGVLGRRLGP